MENEWHLYYCSYCLQSDSSIHLCIKCMRCGDGPKKFIFIVGFSIKTNMQMFLCFAYDLLHVGQQIKIRFMQEITVHLTLYC